MYSFLHVIYMFACLYKMFSCTTRGLLVRGSSSKSSWEATYYVHKEFEATTICLACDHDFHCCMVPVHGCSTLV